MITLIQNTYPKHLSTCFFVFHLWLQGFNFIVSSCFSKGITSFCIRCIDAYKKHGRYEPLILIHQNHAANL